MTRQTRISSKKKRCAKSTTLWANLIIIKHKFYNILTNNAQMLVISKMLSMETPMSINLFKHRNHSYDVSSLNKALRRKYYVFFKILKEWWHFILVTYATGDCAQNIWALRLSGRLQQTRYIGSADKSPPKIKIRNIRILEWVLELLSEY